MCGTEKRNGEKMGGGSERDGQTDRQNEKE